MFDELRAGDIVDVPGISIGHAESVDNSTGCSVILFDNRCKSATAGISVRGAASGTRETDLLHSQNTVERIHAIVLAGGSAFGLDAAGGVMEALEEKDIGINTGVCRVPIVPSAVLFDLDYQSIASRPSRSMGYDAVECMKTYPGNVNVGVGAGCTVGKLYGQTYAMKGDVGSASVHRGDGIYLGAFVAVNAFGDIVDRMGNIVAGCYSDDGSFVNTLKTFLNDSTETGNFLADQ